MKEIQIHSLDQTREFAGQMADLIRGKTITVCLDGDLGAGKTTWTQSFGKALGVKNTINSPTFTIMKNYRQADGRPFNHIDAYRLEGIHQDLGFDEIFEEGITVVEWGTYIQDQIPKDHISISIEEGIDENRTIRMEGTGPVSKAVVQEVKV